MNNQWQGGQYPYPYPYPPPPPRKTPWYLPSRGVVLLTLLLGSCGALYHVTKDAGQKAQTRNVLQPASPAVDVPAAKLFADYQANEVAADAKYKGNHLRVTGTVKSIDKNFADDIVVLISTSNAFMPIHANVKSSQTVAAAQLTKGGPVTVMCSGAGMVLGSPILRDCTLGG